MGASPEGDGSQGLGVAGTLVAMGHRLCPGQFLDGACTPSLSCDPENWAEQDPALCEPHRPPPLVEVPFSPVGMSAVPQVHPQTLPAPCHPQGFGEYQQTSYGRSWAAQHRGQCLSLPPWGPDSRVGRGSRHVAPLGGWPLLLHPGTSPSGHTSPAVQLEVVFATRPSTCPLSWVICDLDVFQGSQVKGPGRNIFKRHFITQPRTWGSTPVAGEL